MQPAVGQALLHRVHADASTDTMNKCAALETAVLGWPWGYDYRKQRAALDELDRLKAAGRPFTDLSPSSYAELAKSNSSFTGPTFTTLTSLRDAGIPARPHVILDMPGNNVGDVVRRIARDPNVGSVIQIGALSPENSKVLEQSGKHFGRLATDYGSGGFLQPRYHIDGNGAQGAINGMYIDPAVRYNSVYIPGGKLLNWQGIPSSARTVPIGRLATSPMFGSAGFNQTHGPTVNALFTTGGGSGRGMPFEYRTLGNLGAATDRSLMHPEPNILDHILTALRNKHGDRARMDYLTAINPRSAEIAGMTPEEYEYIFNRAQRLGPIDLDVQKDVWAMKQFLDPSSPAHQRIRSRPGGEAFLRRLAERYRGLNMVPRVELPDMARYYGNADYIFDLPGSSVGEITQMQGQKTPGMIHLVPREYAYNPRHFRGNALATNALMQPGARNNIVSVASPTIAQDIQRAVNEGGFRDWGRAPIMSSTESMRPLVRDIQRAHRLRALKSGLSADKILRGLWRVARRIR